MVDQRRQRAAQHTGNSIEQIQRRQTSAALNIGDRFHCPVDRFGKPRLGFLDVLLISEHGRLVVVECKLWRNPQARREVVGQILDYARELARYGYEDLQRIVSNRLGRQGNILYELASAAGSPSAKPSSWTVWRVISKPVGSFC